jgi:hypothetical protein
MEKLIYYREYFTAKAVSESLRGCEYDEVVPVELTKDHQIDPMYAYFKKNKYAILISSYYCIIFRTKIIRSFSSFMLVPHLHSHTLKICHEHQELPLMYFMYPFIDVGNI